MLHSAHAVRPLVRRRSRGLTLIELIVVLMIVATLAGLLIPQISMIGRSSDMAATAKTQADVAHNIQTYFVLQKRYPIRMDSLLVSDGTTPTGVYIPDDADSDGNQDTGLPDSGPHLDEDLQMTDLTVASGFVRSFTRSGFTEVMDHDRTEINSNASGNIVRALSSSSDIPVAEVIEGSDLAIKLFPSTGGAFPANTTVVALGFGPSNDAIAKTSMNAPIYPGCDGTYYGHYVGLFQCFADGSRAVLIGVVDSYGRAPNYSIQQFNESLPKGARRG